MGKRVTFAAVLAALATSLSLPAPTAVAAAYEPQSGFCSEPVLRDYLAPLARLPKLHSPPESGRVGFGPPGLIVRARPALLVDERKVGYTLGLRRSEPPVRLDWDIATTLTLIDRRGRPIEIRRRVNRHVNAVSRGNGAGVQFTVGPEPGLYRLTSVFRNSSGRKLGGYGLYFRAVAPTDLADLELAADSRHPGQSIVGRIENLGTTLVRYGTPYAIERFDGSSWALAPESPRGPWIAIAFHAFAGSAGKCSSFEIPASMPPGRYRMTKTVIFYRRDLRRRETGDRTVSAEFDVLP